MILVLSLKAITLHLANLADVFIQSDLLMRNITRNVSAKCLFIIIYIYIKKWVHNGLYGFAHSQQRQCNKNISIYSTCLFMYSTSMCILSHRMYYFMVTSLYIIKFNSGEIICIVPVDTGWYKTWLLAHKAAPSRGGYAL